MTYPKFVVDDTSSMREVPTPNLRWVVGGDTIDNRRLQQAWVIVTHGPGCRVEEKTEWRDVPTEFES